MTETLNQAIDLIDQLQPAEQAQLLEVLSRRVARHVAGGPPRPAATSDDSWAKLEAFRREMEALGDAAPDFGAALDADRNHARQSLEGK